MAFWLTIPGRVRHSWLVPPGWESCSQSITLEVQLGNQNSCKHWNKLRICALLHVPCSLVVGGRGKYSSSTWTFDPFQYFTYERILDGHAMQSVRLGRLASAFQEAPNQCNYALRTFSQPCCGTSTAVLKYYAQRVECKMRNWAASKIEVECHSLGISGKCWIIVWMFHRTVTFKLIK